MRELPAVFRYSVAAGRRAYRAVFGRTTVGTLSLPASCGNDKPIPAERALISAGTAGLDRGRRHCARPFAGPVESGSDSGNHRLRSHRRHRVARVRWPCAVRHSMARNARLCRIQIVRSLHSPERWLGRAISEYHHSGLPIPLDTVTWVV